jgi:hypothetical protein
MASGSRIGDALSGRALGVGVSILIHLALLLPIGLAAPRLKRLAEPTREVVVPVVLFPVDAGRRAADAPAEVSPQASPASAVPTQGVVLKPPDEADAPSAAISAPQEASQVQAREGRTADDWIIAAGRRLVRPCPQRLGESVRGPCPGVGQTERSAPDRRALEPEAYARIGPSRASRTDQTREEGFDRQARANEAWRDYTRGEGPYPGLRSLFTER